MGSAKTPENVSTYFSLRRVGTSTGNARRASSGLAQHKASGPKISAIHSLRLHRKNGPSPLGHSSRKPNFHIFRRAEEVAPKLGRPPGDKQSFLDSPSLRQHLSSNSRGSVLLCASGNAWSRLRLLNPEESDSGSQSCLLGRYTPKRSMPARFSHLYAHAACEELELAGSLPSRPSLS
jgi:hypothetical protein